MNTSKNGNRNHGPLRLFHISLMAAMMTSFTAALMADNLLQQNFVLAESLDQLRLDLYPAKERVKGMLWGTNEIYPDGAIKLRVACEQDGRIPIEEADGSERVIFADRNRVELYRMNDDEWVFATWYKIADNSRKGCQALRDSALLLNGKNRLSVKLLVKESGMSHRNLVEEWKLEN